MMEEAEPATATEHAGAACLSTVSAVSAVSSQASAGALFAAAQRASAASKAMEEARNEDQKALAALRLAQSFDFIRFDAAMTLLSDHYRRLWFPAAASEAVIAGRAEH